jgi:hypothetical protein
MHGSPPGWAAFVSLEWYDKCISFLFRFAAKTSELLLAAGVIVSAADFLQKGELMTQNPTLSLAWAWTQALAIEASIAPVLVFALQAFKDRDTIKGVLYTVLTVLLFLVGGAMLYLQLHSSVAGFSEAALSAPVLDSLLALRVLVSIGVIALTCTKHIRFSGLLTAQHEPPQTISEETMSLILAKLAKLDELEHMIKSRQTTPITLEEQQEQPLQLASPQKETPDQEEQPSYPVFAAIAAEDVKKVIEAFESGVARREICSFLKWGGQKYTTMVKPVLDAWENQKRTAETVPEVTPMHQYNQGATENAGRTRDII